MKLRKALPLVVAAFAVTPAGASAAVNVDSLAQTPETWLTCHAPVIENPFLFDGDALDYVLAPSGSFELGAPGWQLEGGASVVAGDDPFDLRPDGDESVLSMPAGSRVTSPTMCVDLNYPTFRFAFQQLAEKKLKVQLVYPDVDNPKWRTVEKVRVGNPIGWELTEHLALEPERGGEEPGGRRVAIRMIADGPFQVDDIYVDPHRRN